MTFTTQQLDRFFERTSRKVTGHRYVFEATDEIHNELVRASHSDDGSLKLIRFKARSVNEVEITSYLISATSNKRNDESTMTRKMIDEPVDGSLDVQILPGSTVEFHSALGIYFVARGKFGGSDSPIQINTRDGVVVPKGLKSSAAPNRKSGGGGAGKNDS